MIETVDVSISGFRNEIEFLGFSNFWVSGEIEDVWLLGKYGCLVAGKIWASGENMGVWLLGKSGFLGKIWKEKKLRFFLLIIREKKKNTNLDSSNLL